MKTIFPIELSTREEMISLLPQNISIAEIGVFKGDFSKILFNILKPSNLYLVDVFSGIAGSGDKNGENFEFINLSESFNELEQYFKHHKSVQLVKSYSDQFLESLQDELLDAVYIDADHSYLSVKKDLAWSRKKVKKGGFIMGHDYHNEMFPSVVQAVSEFCQQYSLEIKYITKDGCPSFLIQNN